MKLFEKTRAHLEIVGIQLIQDNHSIEIYLKRCLLFFMLMQLVICSSVHLLFQAKTFGEYAFSFYVFITTLTHFMLFTLTIYNLESILKLFNDFQKLIEKRKLQISHKK